MNISATLASGIATGAFFALLAMALQMTYSASGVLNFAQGDLAVGGAFAYWALTTKAGINVVASLLITIVIGFVVGAMVFGIVRLFTERSALEASLATIAISFGLEGVFQYVYGSQTDIGIPLIAGAPLHLFGAVLPRQNVAIVGLAIIIAVAVALILRTTKLGLMVRMVASNRNGARATGVSIPQVQGAVFAIGGAMSFAAGAAIVPITGASFISGQTLIITSFVAAVLGGLGGLWTAGAGGLVLGIIQSYLGTTSAGTYTETALFIVLMAVLLLRPNGLFSWRSAAAH
jgi:branched-chain amino acid transport system permease protein